MKLTVNNEMFKTSNTEWHGDRAELLKSAFDAVTSLLRDYPYIHRHSDDRAAKYREYTKAMELLGKLNALELMGMFAGHTMSDGDKAFHTNRVQNLITRFGRAERPLDNISAAHLIAAIDKMGDPSWGIWSDFFMNLVEVAEHRAKTSGEDNIYNALRLSKGCPNSWETEEEVLANQLRAQSNAERRVRRQAKRLGYILKKSRKRVYDYDNHGQYALINPQFNVIVCGDRFDSSIEDIAEFLNSRA